MPKRKRGNKAISDYPISKKLCRLIQESQDFHAYANTISIRAITLTTNKLLNLGRLDKASIANMARCLYNNPTPKTLALTLPFIGINCPSMLAKIKNILNNNEAFFTWYKNIFFRDAAVLKSMHKVQAITSIHTIFNDIQRSLPIEICSLVEDYCNRSAQTEESQLNEPHKLLF